MNSGAATPARIDRLWALGATTARAVSRGLSGPLGIAPLSSASISLWPFGKPKVADPRGALRQMAQADGDARRRDVAAAVNAAIDACRFRETKQALAPIAYERLHEKPTDDRAVAALFARMVNAATAATSTTGEYVDDRSVVARHGAAYLRDHGEHLETRAVADMLCVALHGRRFTDSNVAMARHGLDEIAHGASSDDASLARLARRLTDAAENAQASGGRFQADKSAVANAVLPWLSAHVSSDASKRLLGLAAAAMKKNSFAASHEAMTKVVLDAVRAGDGSDRALARAAAALVNAGETGTSSALAYLDDRSGAALRGAQFLAANLERPESKTYIALLEKALDRTSFTSTVTDVAAVAFQHVARGSQATPQRLAGAALEMLDAATASESTQGTYLDDKSRVAANTLEHLEQLAETSEAALLARLGREAVRSARYTSSSVKASQAALQALTRTSLDRHQLAAAATRMIDAGTTAGSAEELTAMSQGVMRTLAGAEVKFDRSRLALDMVAEMMKTNAILTERSTVAKAAVSLWGEADPTAPIDPFQWARALGEAAPGSATKRRVLAAAARRLANDHGPEEAEKAGVLIDRLWRSSDDDHVCSGLLTYLDTLERTPRAQETVTRMAEALNDTAARQGEAPRVEVAEEYVVIGGVRIAKKGAS